ncbi:CBS domain-containing protein [Streptomyces sp. NBC_00669]|uniref:CBS domain-containing protein n=1 Tax=Streptomyces sp. NBC_00669 TaxID=2976011 RepID=UPI002E355A12|nr:CBS domain-containing protein [Streptomyces sp. NBC_00669]
MRARELARSYPTVTLGSPALDAARLLAGRGLPGVLVVDADGAPYAIVPASRFVRLLVPSYVVEDPTLAAVIDEQHADRLCAALADRAVADILPRERMAAPVVAGDATVLEVAALMARERSPLVAVMAKEPDGTRLLGVITASHLLDRLLGVA